MHLSRRSAAISLSLTLALDARAKALAAEGVDVINMAVGEPDFPAPAAARRAAIERIESGDVRYTPAGGELALRARIAAHLTRTRGVDYEAADVVVCHSAKHALSGAFQALCDPGDEVLIPLPAWGSFHEVVRLSGASPVEVRPRLDCGPDLEAIEGAVGPRTRAVLVNSPSNPSGYVWTAGEMARLVELAHERDLWVVSDEIYRRLVYGPPSPSPVETAPDARERVVVVDGASKTFAMTGYRIGFAAGPRALVDAMTRIQSQMTGSPNAVSQSAFLACLREEPPEVAEMVAEFARRRDAILAELERLDLPFPHPGGAFYAFPDVSAHTDERGSVAFCEELLERENVVLVPGAAFGLEGHVRLTYALSVERLREAMSRLESFLGR